MNDVRRKRPKGPSVWLSLSLYYYRGLTPLLIIHQVIKEVELAGEFVRHLLL